jgi:hypothetical protein
MFGGILDTTDTVKCVLPFDRNRRFTGADMVKQHNIDFSAGFTKSAVIFANTLGVLSEYEEKCDCISDFSECHELL